MFDLPNTPTVGQITTGPGGAAYRWDGVKWVASTSAFMAEAPSDGTLYGRRNAAWSNLSQADLVALGEYNDAGRNVVHNPLFNIAQRGAGPFTALSGLTLDRWSLAGNTGDTLSVTQTALSDTDRSQIGDEQAANALQNVFTGGSGAGNFIMVLQRIEAVRRTSNKTVTMSFWAKASVAALKFGVAAAQNFGSGGSPSAQNVVNGSTVTLSTTWARYSMPLALPSVAGKTLGTNGDDNLEIELWYSSGSTNAGRTGIGVQSGTIWLWGVQVEIGSGAGYPTPLAKRDPQQDLALCQRYYYAGQFTMIGYGSAGQGFGGDLYFPVVMRAVPTFALGSSASSNIGALTPAGLSTAAGSFGVQLTGPITALGAVTINQQFTASADL